jgi:hypothetical protein
MGADPRQQQQQFGNTLQVFQMKDAMQQRDAAKQQQMQEKRTHKKISSLADRGVGLFMKYQSLKEQGFSEQSAHAAMQEDFKRELGGLASERFDDGSPLYDQQELQQFGQEFNAGELGMILPKLMGAKNALDLHFKTQDDKRQSAALDETKRHNRATESAPKGGGRPVPVADKNSPTGFVYQTPEGAVGQPAPAPRAQNNTRYSAKELQAARDKVRTVGIARQQLANIKEKWAALTGKDGAISAGPFLAGRLPTEAGSNFDAAVDQFRSTITSLTRTPGVGAMSDYETKLDQSKLPTRRDYESSTAQKIKDLEDFINNLDSGYADIVNEGQQPGAQAPGSDQDVLDAADAILNGE